MLDGTNQNLVVYKSGGHEFMHGLPVDNGDILAVFPCSASLKPLPENYFDEEKNDIRPNNESSHNRAKPSRILCRYRWRIFWWLVMAKYRFCRKYHDYKKNQIVDGMRMDNESVMIKVPYNTGFVSTIEPLFLGSQRLLVKVK